MSDDICKLGKRRYRKPLKKAGKFHKDRVYCVGYKNDVTKELSDECKACEKYIENEND